MDDELTLSTWIPVGIMKPTRCCWRCWRWRCAAADAMLLTLQNVNGSYSWHSCCRDGSSRILPDWAVSSQYFQGYRSGKVSSTSRLPLDAIKYLLHTVASTPGKLGRLSLKWRRHFKLWAVVQRQQKSVNKCLLWSSMLPSSTIVSAPARRSVRLGKFCSQKGTYWSHSSKDCCPASAHKPIHVPSWALLGQCFGATLFPGPSELTSVWSANHAWKPLFVTLYETSQTCQELFKYGCKSGKGCIRRCKRVRAELPWTVLCNCSDLCERGEATQSLMKT